MMLEQSLITPNFLGKESFRWFIGVVSQYTKVQEASIGGGYKAKVRIIGYHPDTTADLEDKDLPWAHVLVPLSMGTGTGGAVSYTIPKGGETVVGFFLDGDNAQQPIIIGGLFSGYDIVHPNTFKQGTKNYDPFRPFKSPINLSNKSSVDKKSSDSKTKATLSPGSDGQVQDSKGDHPSCASQLTENTDTVVIPPKCKSSKSTYSRILQALRTFIKVLNTINQVTSLISDIPFLIQSAISDTIGALSDLFSDYIKWARDWVITRIHEWFSKNVIDRFLGKDAKLLKDLAKEKIIDGIWCAFRKILNGMVKFVGDFLNQIVDKIISFPFCAVEALVGSVLSAIENQISDALAPLIEQFESAVGGTLGQIGSYIFLALDYATAALNFLSCEGSSCAQSLNYQMNKGFINDSFISDIRKTLGAPARGIRDANTASQDFLDKNTGFEGSCDVTNLTCGLPTVEIFGGGGFGAAGFAVVDALGQVAGVNLTNFGSGYTSAPYISIVDACENGSGAQASTVINENGQVSQVIMDSSGIGYLGPNTNTETGIGIGAGTDTGTGTGTILDPCNINPVDESGSEVIGFIVGVKIVRPGVEYTSEDLITNVTCNSDVKIYPIVDSIGRIVGTNIVNPGTAIRVFPELLINSENGEGAILQPILSFKPIETVGIETNQSKVKKVVLCAEDHNV
jgi:hypothetical protein